jgi:type 1 glutamine amidotransferase
MRKIRLALIALLVLALCVPLGAQQAKKKILFVGQTKGFHHDSTSPAMGTIWKLGQQSGLWDTWLKTDCQWITKKPVKGGNQKNLGFFDAVIFYTTGSLDMDESQKADLISFVKDDGKGFLGIHAATDTFYEWPEYGEMIGGWFDQHPWNTFEAPLVVEDPGFPGMQHVPRTFTMRDEIYQIKNFSRENVRVLMTLDADKLDLKNPRVHRTDKDFAVIWARNYGKGRVLYNGLGHPNEVWDRADIQKMFTDQIRWVLGLIPGDATPRPKPAR